MMGEKMNCMPAKTVPNSPSVSEAADGVPWVSDCTSRGRNRRDDAHRKHVERNREKNEDRALPTCRTGPGCAADRGTWRLIQLIGNLRLGCRAVVPGVRLGWVARASRASSLQGRGFAGAGAGCAEDAVPCGQTRRRATLQGRSCSGVAPAKKGEQNNLYA